MTRFPENIFAIERSLFLILIWKPMSHTIYVQMLSAIECNTGKWLH